MQIADAYACNFMCLITRLLQACVEAHVTREKNQAPQRAHETRESKIRCLSKSSVPSERKILKQNIS